VSLSAINFYNVYRISLLANVAIVTAHAWQTQLSALMARITFTRMLT